MKLVIIESPYKGDVARNKRYLQACIRDCLRRGESPYASHQMLTDALDDKDPEQRNLGIEAGLSWRRARQAILVDDSDAEIGTLRHDFVRPVFYVDLGITDGMNRAMNAYVTDGMPFDRRNLPPDDPFFLWDARVLLRCAGFYGDARAKTEPACGWEGIRSRLENNCCPVCGAGHIVSIPQVLQGNNT